MIRQAKRFQTATAHPRAAALTDPRKSALSSNRMTKAGRSDGSPVEIEPPHLPAASLTADEEEELYGAEEKIEHGARAWLVMGKALADIQTKRLYRSTHFTFEIYVAERWHMDRSIAYGLIAAVRVVRLASTVADITGLRITNESQCRPLAKLDDAGVVEVLKKVAKKIAPNSDGTKVLTARLLSDVAREYKTPTDDVKRQPAQNPEAGRNATGDGKASVKRGVGPLSSFQPREATLTDRVGELLPELIEQAERISGWKNSSKDDTEDFAWTCEEVLFVALRRGLDEMEERCRPS